MENFRQKKVTGCTHSFVIKIHKRNKSNNISRKHRRHACSMGKRNNEFYRNFWTECVSTDKKLIA